MVGIGEHREREFILLAESRELLDPIRADSDHGVSGGDEPIVAIAEIAGLGRAPRRECLRVEVDDKALPGEIRERHFRPGLVEEGELRSAVSHFRSHDVSSAVPIVGLSRSRRLVADSTRSCPHAASMSVPRVSRSVQVAPCRLTSSTKRRVRSAEGATLRASGVGFNAMILT